jgi:hypothetical protein
MMLRCTLPYVSASMVYAMSRDKDVRTCLKNVLAVVPPSNIHFVQVRAVVILLVYSLLFISPSSCVRLSMDLLDPCTQSACLLA